MRERTQFQHGIRAGLFVLAASALALAAYVGWPRPDPYIAAPPQLEASRAGQCPDGWASEVFYLSDGSMRRMCRRP